MSDGPVYCYNCELRLDYVVESRDEAYRCVDWLKSLIEQGIPVPRKNWADLSRAIDALPLTDKKWRAVEYVVYLGTSVDPELVSP